MESINTIWKNSATYKFAFAKSLLELVNNETTKISLSELSQPFSRNIIEHCIVSAKSELLKVNKYIKSISLVIILTDKHIDKLIKNYHYEIKCYVDSLINISTTINNVVMKI